MRNQHKIVFFVVLVTALLMFMEFPSSAQKPFLTRVKKLYGLGREVGNCSLCHKFDKDKGESPHDENLNVYGEAIRQNDNMKGLHKKGDDYRYSPEELDKVEAAAKAVENADSDGDGATNVEELMMGTLPGDAKSTPTKEALEKYRKDHPAGAKVEDKKIEEKK
jgi:hypothetical protein